MKASEMLAARKAAKKEQAVTGISLINYNQFRKDLVQAEII